MNSYRNSLDGLCRCLCGVVPDAVDWMSVLRLANHTLTTTSLIDLVDRDHAVPDDVSAYIREIYRRNVERNLRLAEQLSELLAAVNRVGVKPVLVKGAAFLAATPRDMWGRQIMSDLDIVVGPDEVGPTLEAMQELGYVVHGRTPDNVEKWFVDLKRPQDVGMVDLHRGLPGPLFFYQALGDVKGHSSIVQFGDGLGYLPSATCRALILILHDQFQDADYWIGDLDLRHLLNLRDLAIGPEKIDWNLLAMLTPSKLARNALESQLIALSSLLSVGIPAAMSKRLIPRLQFRRRVAQASFPVLRYLFLLLAVLDFDNYRQGPGVSRRTSSGISRRLGPRPGWRRLFELLGWCHARRLGKV